MAPIEEHFSHSIGTTCYDYNKESKWLATGGRDGNIFLRHANDIGSEPSPIKAHSIFSGGVTALCFSKTMQMIYTAGGDGSFMIWSYGPNKAYPSHPIEVPIAKNGLEDLPELQRVPANQIKVFSEILKDEFLKQQEGAKAQFK
jgi:WD40 repeat protein